MNDLKKNIRRIFALYFLLFGVTVGYLCKYIFIDSKTVVNNSYNPRLRIMDEGIVRGEITDNTGVVLAGSGGGLRSYPYGRKAAHLVGTTQMGKSGVESRYNFLLQHPSSEILQRVRHITSGVGICGDNVVLTVDAGMQSALCDALGENNGAAVVVEPSTGRILAMVSYPNFEPSLVEEDWEELSGDSDNSPLLNRATQGTYPPGSIFKVITASAGLENGYGGFTFECTGEAEFNGERLRCYNSNAHGEVGMSEAMAVSCNGYFAALALELGADVLFEACERACFNNDLEYPIERGKSSFVLAGDNTGQIIQTAIGQGQTVVTPLHMAMMAAAVANGGLMMKPYVLEKQVSVYGDVRSMTLPSALGRAFGYEEAGVLTEMMVEAVENGTAAPAKVSGVKIAAKTGTAQNPQGDDHGWVVAFAPADNPRIAIAVVTENSGGPRKGLELVKTMVEGLR